MDVPTLVGQFEAGLLTGKYAESLSISFSSPCDTIRSSTCQVMVIWLLIVDVNIRHAGIILTYGLTLKLLSRLLVQPYLLMANFSIP